MEISAAVWALWLGNYLTFTLCYTYYLAATHVQFKGILVHLLLILLHLLLLSCTDSVL